MRMRGILALLVVLALSGAGGCGEPEDESAWIPGVQPLLEAAEAVEAEMSREDFDPEVAKSLIAATREALAAYEPIEEHMDFPDPAAGPEEELQLAQRYRLLEAALQRLQADYRQVLLLREVEEMSYAEIGEVLGLREGTVKSRIARARQALLEVCKDRI